MRATHSWSQFDVLTTFPQRNCWPEFPEMLNRNLIFILYYIIISLNSKIKRCGIPFNMTLYLLKVILIDFKDMPSLLQSDFTSHSVTKGCVWHQLTCGVTSPVHQPKLSAAWWCRARTIVSIHRWSYLQNSKHIHDGDCSPVCRFIQVEACLLIKNKRVCRPPK